IESLRLRRLPHLLDNYGSLVMQIVTLRRDLQGALKRVARGLQIAGLIVNYGEIHVSARQISANGCGVGVSLGCTGQIAGTLARDAEVEPVIVAPGLDLDQILVVARRLLIRTCGEGG